MTTVFLSYQFRERELANALAARLDVANGDLDGFDQRVRHQESSDDALPLKAEIAGGIAGAAALVCIVGPTTATSSWVRWELAEAGRIGRPVFLLRPDPADALPEALTEGAPAGSVADLDSLMRLLEVGA